MVFLDYDLKIRVVSDYDAIANSDLFAQFCQMAEGCPAASGVFCLTGRNCAKGLAKITVKGERVAKSPSPHQGEAAVVPGIWGNRADPVEMQIKPSIWENKALRVGRLL